MSITIGQLVNIANYRTRVFAGAAGLDREISWAHVCELPDPTEYLANGELLMTVGYTIPEQPRKQARYVERLSEIGLSGLLVAEQMHAPKLSPLMLAAADRCSFPILLTAYDVPFTAISRGVAEANHSEEHARLRQTLQLYDTVRAAVGNASGFELIDRVGEVVECQLFIVDPYRGRAILPGSPEPPTDLASTLTEEMSTRAHPMPAILRLRARQPLAMVFFVPASRPAALIMLSERSEPPGLPLMRHVAEIAALEVERSVAEYERKRRLGAELLAGLIDNRMSADSATHMLEEWGLHKEPRMLATCTSEGGEGEHSDLHLRLGDHGIPYLLLRRAPILTALLPDTPKGRRAFRKEVAFEVDIGFSARLGRLTRIPEAYREARWALQGANASDESVARYGEGPVLSPFLPHSLSEVEGIVQHVLGPLLDYDRTHDSDLTVSLRQFLAYNRSWQRAAASLHVHKQTLIYRMRRVEELTGRHLDQTEDVAELWFALRAAEASDNTAIP